MDSILESINLRDAGAVIAALIAGRDACAATPGRRGCTEWVQIDPAHAGTPGATLIATGDLHDNPLHLARLVRAAGIDDAWHARLAGDASHPGPCHLTLHELIHGDRLVNGLDYSYRLLARAAAMKAAFPDRVHVLLANHEIAQLAGTPVAKEGIRCNEAFDEALDAAFRDDAPRVRDAVHAFLAALPLAIRFRTPGIDGDLICAHSLPAPETMASFEISALDRDLTPDDFSKRTGAARVMTWGRGHSAADIEDLASRFQARVFILGHEKAEEGFTVISPRAIVLNSDHERGVYAQVDLTLAAQASDIARRCVQLGNC